EEPEAARAALRDLGEDTAEEPLHTLVHEARLPRAGSPVKVEKVADSRFDLGGRAHRRHPGVGGLAFEASGLSHELVTVLSGEAGEVGFPRGRQSQDWTSFFHG